MNPKFNEYFLSNRKFKICAFVFFVAFLALSTNLNASATPFNGHLIKGKAHTSYLYTGNMLFQMNKKNNTDAANYSNLMFSKSSQVKISDSKIYSGALQPVKKAPVTSYFMPFLMMALGYFLWKIHNRIMKKND